MNPCQGNTILFRSSQQLSRLRLGPLKCFLADAAPFKGPQLTWCFASRTKEIQRTLSSVTRQVVRPQV